MHIIHTYSYHTSIPTFYGICPHLGDRCEVAMMCSCLSPPGVPLFAAFASSYVSGLKTGDKYGLGAMGQNWRPHSPTDSLVFFNNFNHEIEKFINFQPQPQYLSRWNHLRVHCVLSVSHPSHLGGHLPNDPQMTTQRFKASGMSAPRIQWEIFRILKCSYRTIFLAIFCGDIPWNLGLI